MTVRRLWATGKRFRVSGVGSEPTGVIRPLEGEGNPADLRALCKAALLCNNARLLAPDSHGQQKQGLEQPPGLPSASERRWTSLGDQTEAALKVLAIKYGLDEAALVKSYPRLHELPFEARRKRMSTIHHNSRSDIAFVKGAPREVLQLCTQIMVDGTAVPLDEA